MIDKDQDETEVILRLEDVTKTYQVGAVEVPALRGVSFDVPRGAFWAVMGPSGSGKSTLLNLLGCLDRPTSGRFYLDGAEVAEFDDFDRSEVRLHRLGFIFQSFHLIPQLTVRENIELPLYYQGWAQDRSAERAEELATLVELDTHLRHRPMELSGGQRQRVAIARALANDPAVILADEPTGNLDSETGNLIMRLLKRLNDEGRTILLVTHEDHIADYARWRLTLKDGRIESLRENGG